MMKYHPTPVRMAIIKKTKTSVGKNVASREPVHPWHSVYVRSAKRVVFSVLRTTNEKQKHKGRLVHNSSGRVLG
jgi:hypothetical protein